MSLLLDAVVGRLHGRVNRLFDAVAGGASRPTFFDVEATCPELHELQRHYDVIRAEVEALLPRRENIPKYHELDPVQTPISHETDGGKSWRVFLLAAMGEVPDANRRACPETSALLERVPNLFQAFFSILDPEKSIPPHEGPYKGYIRYHLGLIVPREAPPRMRVKDEWRTWAEGEGFLFDDSWEHEVQNSCKAERVVLVVDVLRPMPFPLHTLNVVLTDVVISRYYGKRVVAHVERAASHL